MEGEGGCGRGFHRAGGKGKVKGKVKINIMGIWKGKRQRERKSVMIKAQGSIGVELSVWKINAREIQAQYMTKCGVSSGYVGGRGVYSCHAWP